MKLSGIYKGEDYYPARGTHKGLLYQIVIEQGKFLLERVTIGIGIGKLSEPIGFFDEDWKGVYVEEI